MYLITFKTLEQAHAIITAHGILGYHPYMNMDKSDGLISRYLSVFNDSCILVDESAQWYTVLTVKNATDGSYGEVKIKTYEEWNA